MDELADAPACLSKALLTLWSLETEIYFRAVISRILIFRLARKRMEEKILLG
ncbi:hypothetical protein M1146_00095 [Patescibacteria group bacterium]|nr:hypothetical protein [Patescibacteria group bacterium]